MDFVQDATCDGRALRFLIVVDDYTREQSAWLSRTFVLPQGPLGERRYWLLLARHQCPVVVEGVLGHRSTRRIDDEDGASTSHQLRVGSGRS